MLHSFNCPYPTNKQKKERVQPLLTQCFNKESPRVSQSRPTGSLRATRFLQHRRQVGQSRDRLAPGRAKPPRLSEGDWTHNLTGNVKWTKSSKSRLVRQRHTQTH